MSLRQIGAQVLKRLDPEQQRPPDRLELAGGAIGFVALGGGVALLNDYLAPPLGEAAGNAAAAMISGTVVVALLKAAARIRRWRNRTYSILALTALALFVGILIASSYPSIVSGHEPDDDQHTHGKVSGSLRNHANQVAHSPR